jgi:hypothetical protein
MTITNTSICNEALNLCGAKSINNLEDGTDNARRCAALYDSTRKALLRMHPWSCAKKRVVLAPTTTHPTFGYKNAFPLPKDFLRVYDPNTQCFEIENRHILSNQDSIQLVYIYDNDNEETWDSLLVEAMALYLCSKIAKPITGSQAESDSAYQKLMNLLKQARAINGQERPAQDFFVGEANLVEVRY